MSDCEKWVGAEKCGSPREWFILLINELRYNIQLVWLTLVVSWHDAMVLLKLFWCPCRVFDWVTFVSQFIQIFLKPFSSPECERVSTLSTTDWGHRGLWIITSALSFFPSFLFFYPFLFLSSLVSFLFPLSPDTFLFPFLTQIHFLFYRQQKLWYISFLIFFFTD